MEGESKNVHEMHRDRVREKFISGGLDNFAEHEALEMLLFYCIPRKDTNALAHKMLREFGSLNNLLDADAREIARRCKITLRAAVLLSMIPPLSKIYEKSKFRAKPKFSSPREVGEYAVSLFRGETNECFYIICLDTQRKLIASELITRGQIDGATVYPRQMVEAAIKHHATFVIITHNHPSSRLDASEEDLRATEKIIRALHAIGIEVLDHIIVGGDKYLSFKEERLI